MRTVKLGEHAKLIRGITFKPAEKCDPRDEGAVVCMRTKNIQATLDDSDLIAVPSSLVKNREKFISTGDILVSSANSWNLVGKCCQVQKLQYPSTAGGFISILRPKTEHLDASYLYRWFSSEGIQRKVRSFGNQTTNISNLDHKRTLKLQIPLPPFDEQKRIAGILDEADALRAKRRESLVQLDTLLQSTFLNMFGDPVTNPMGWAPYRFDDLLTLVQYGPRFYNEEYTPSGVKIVRITDLDFEGNLDFESMPTLEVSDDDRERFGLVPGDLILARTGATVGKTALIRAGDPECIAGAYFIRMRFQASVSPLYAQWVLRSAGVQAIIWQKSQQSAQPNFNGPAIRKLPLPVPPLELQHRFAAIVESVEQQKARQRAHLAELDTLFASLQSRAFRGAL